MIDILEKRGTIGAEKREHRFQELDDAHATGGTRRLLAHPAVAWHRWGVLGKMERPRKMDNRFTSLLASWVGTALLAGPASASIIGMTGALVEISPPGSVELGALESNSEIYAFAEMLGLMLEGDLAVDITSPGSYSSADDLTPGFIFPEMPVDVYFLHSDPVGGDTVKLVGSITFDQDILGIIVLSASLDATDFILGFPGTVYPTGLSGRGLDFAGTNFDILTLSEDRRTINVDWRTGFKVDQIRIITAVPGPGGLALLVLAGLVGVRRRRR